MKILQTKHLFIIGFFITFLNGFAIQAETLVGLVDENRVLTEAIELHLTSKDAPIINSTVSLNNEDAWLFFDHIKPSVVVDHYLSSIMVNGEAFSEGVNGRIAIYAQGTVLIPHSSAFKPLTVYDNDNFLGTSEAYGLHTYFNDLGNMNNTIKSFKLKRGYMATLANNSDGSGYSRVFIADDEDLEFTIMPAELSGSVSFIRVFKYQWVTKKGWAGWNADEYQMTNSTWYYDWNVGGTTSHNIEYTPIRQNAGWPGWTDLNSKQNVCNILGYNEPDHTEQSDISVDEAIDMWPSFMNSGLRIGAPATTNFAWLYDFISKCDELNYRVDFVAVHAYWGSSASSYYNTLKYVHERTGRPIWITEWNYGANWTNEYWPDDPSEYTDANADHALSHIQEIVEMFDTCHFIERYAIYNWVENARAMVLNGALTKAGEFYANNNSKIAFDQQNVVIPHWNYTSPVISYSYLKLQNSIKVVWTDENEELSRGYMVEKKINDGSYEVVYNSDDISVLTFTDPLDSDVKGKVTYRVSLLSVDGEYIPSNEVSYFQTGGANSIQAGMLDVNNTDWAFNYYSEVQTEKPMVILGAPTLNNLIAVSQRVNFVTTSYFKFHLDTWNYLNNPTLSKADKFSVLALPPGTYDFDGLKGEAGTVSGVKRDWVTVNFSEAFNTLPVVFCTQVSNSSSFATTIAIQNVTATGFEVCIKSEEAISDALYGDNINFLAIEPGDGAMDGMPFTVGVTEEGAGIKTSPLLVNYAVTYNNPAVFGSLLTSSNAFASVVRYTDNGDHTIQFNRHRETSNGLSSVLEDKMGWMIMDLSSGQATDVNHMNEPLLRCYPNPVHDIIYFNFDTETRVEIYDMSGQKYIDQAVLHSIDLSHLPSGVYLLKVGHHQIEKIIKQ